MWDSIDQIRNQICGYDEPMQVATPVQNRAREASRLAMRRLYDRRRAMGLNAHGKPLKMK